MSSIYEVRAEGEYAYSFGARRTRREAEVALAESEHRAPPALGPTPRPTIVEIDTSGASRSRRVRRRASATRLTEVAHRGKPYPPAVHVEILDGDRLVMTTIETTRCCRPSSPFGRAAATSR
jgi:hypothetical protein